jgi:hypothetical protein
VFLFLTLSLHIQTVWEYARLTSSAEVNSGPTGWTECGKLLKSFALEALVFVPRRNLMYEFGGLGASISPFRHIAAGGQDTRIVGIVPTDEHSAAVAAAGRAGYGAAAKYSTEGTPIVLEAGGDVEQGLWDQHTGEGLRTRVDQPSSGFWNYTDSFSNNSTSDISFLRVFRTYTVSPRDVVLVKEDEWEEADSA